MKPNPAQKPNLTAELDRIFPFTLTMRERRFVAQRAEDIVKLLGALRDGLRQCRDPWAGTAREAIDRFFASMHDDGAG